MEGNRLILGTANLGLKGGRETAFDLLDAYFELGGRAIDTASIYSDWMPGERGRSETIIGEWMAARGNRHEIRLTTKGGHPPLLFMHKGRCDRASIRHDVELSLKRLNTDRIELYYLHRDEPGRPVAEIIETLQELVAEGKLGLIGCSNWRLPRLEEAQRLGGVTFTANQVLGNVLCRIMEPPTDKTICTLDAAMFHNAVETGTRLQLFTSQCHGLFDKRAAGLRPPASYDNAACERAAERVEAIAAETCTAPGHLVLAFLTALAPNVQPIIGPRDAAQLRKSYPAGDILLSPDVVRAVASATGMEEFVFV